MFSAGETERNSPGASPRVSTGVMHAYEHGANVIKPLIESNSHV